MNPTHFFSEPGEYNVQLSVFNDAGCEATVDSIIVVDPAPIADFEVETGCIGAPTRFIDLSEGEITSWYWNIGEVVSTTQNPTVVF